MDDALMHLVIQHYMIMHTLSFVLDNDSILRPPFAGVSTSSPIIIFLATYFDLVSCLGMVDMLPPQIA
jgi:hypothetical protein